MIEWNVVDYRRLVTDAKRQLKMNGKAYVCNEEQLKAVTKNFKNVYTHKVHEKCYVIYLPKVRR